LHRDRGRILVSRGTTPLERPRRLSWSFGIGVTFDF
jgi:hypothetical protein